MDRVGQKPVVERGAGGGAAGVARGESLAPAREAGAPAELARSVERNDLDEPGSVANGLGIGDEQERVEGRRLDERRAARDAPVERERSPIVVERGSEEPRDGIGAEDEPVVVQPAASSIAARYTVASARPTSARPVFGNTTVGIARTPCSPTAPS